MEPNQVNGGWREPPILNQELPQHLKKLEVPKGLENSYHMDPLGLSTGQTPIEYMERVTKLIRENDHPNQKVKEDNPLEQKPKTKFNYTLHPILQNLEEVDKEPTMSCGKMSSKRSSKEQGEKTPKSSKPNKP